MEEYARYAHTLFKIAMIHLGKKTEAEDAVQEVFYRLLHRAPVFVDETHKKAWLLRVLINICKNMAVSFWRRRIVPLEDVVAYISEPEDQSMLALVLRMPFKYKAVIHLFYYEDYSVKEIANILEISESAVKMRLQRGREQLKWELEGDE
jgi:RNA polymerase sigma factor (sigma-70 family)